MQVIPLSQFCKEHGQARAAAVIGCNQSSVSLMLKARRRVFIVEDGRAYDWCELRGGAQVEVVPLSAREKSEQAA